MENKVRLINRNRLVKCLKNKRLHILNENENNGAAIFDDIIEWIEYEPEIYVVQKEAEVVPEVHGKWENSKYIAATKCGVCGEDIFLDDCEQFLEWKYCPICGVKMDLEE